MTMVISWHVSRYSILYMYTVVHSLQCICSNILLNACTSWLFPSCTANAKHDLILHINGYIVSLPCITLNLVLCRKTYYTSQAACVLCDTCITIKQCLFPRVKTNLICNNKYDTVSNIFIHNLKIQKACTYVHFKFLRAYIIVGDVCRQYTNTKQYCSLKIILLYVLFLLCQYFE